MMKESSADYLEQQKSTRKKIIDLLYKENYCICIPIPNMVQSLLDKVNKTWIQVFLLKKNPCGFSVIPMFMLIFLRNRLLNGEESDQLVNLIHLLMNKLERAQIDSILFETKVNSTNKIFFYSLFSGLIQAKSAKVNEAIRMQGFYKCLQLLLAKVSVEAISCLVLDLKERNIYLIQQAMHSIAYTSLFETQMAYVLVITKNLINQSSQEVVDSSANHCYEGSSLIWYGIATWLRVIKEEISERFRAECLAAIITALFDKISKKTLSQLLLQGEEEALISSFTYIFFTELSEPKKHYRSFHDSFFIFWLEKIVSNANVEQLVMVINKTFPLLHKESALTYFEKHKVASQFFSYVVRFANVSSEERDQLRCISETISEEFFSVHLSRKCLFESLRSHFTLFKQRFCLSNSKDRRKFNESSDINERSALIMHAF